jgi:two-component system response regulator
LKRILLAEDNADDEALTIRAFQKNNIRNEIIVARDGAEALDFLFATGVHANRDTSQLPQVVLLDLKLPKVDGLEVLRRIKGDTRTRALPIVVLTSSRERRDIQACYLAGANSYIVKPVEYAELIAKLGDLVRYWLQLNETPAG